MMFKLSFLLIIVLIELSSARTIYRLARILYQKQVAPPQPQQSTLCDLQNQAQQILLNVKPAQQQMVNETINNIALTLRQEIVNIFDSSVDPATLNAFKSVEPQGYTNLLNILGLVDNNGQVQVNRMAPANNDLCLMQSQLINLTLTLSPQGRQLFSQMFTQFNSAFKAQTPRILQEIYMQNRYNIGQIIQNNPDVFYQFRQLFGGYFSGGSLLNKFRY